MKEVSHKIDEADPITTVLSMGVTRMLGMDSDRHEVVVEHDGKFGRGVGDSHSEAKTEAVHDLNKKK